MILGLILVINTQVYSQTKVATAELKTATAPATASELEAVQDLKEKVASKVAELRHNNERAVAGEISAIEDSGLTTVADDGRQYTVTLDEDLTKYYSLEKGTEKEIQKSDLKVGKYLIASGVINDKTIAANVVYLDVQYLVASGKVTEINNSDYYIKVTTLEKDNLTIDIETNTKINLLNIKTLEIERGGFSKIKEGDTVHFVYQKSGSNQEKNRFSALRILVIPQEYFMK